MSNMQHWMNTDTLENKMSTFNKIKDFVQGDLSLLDLQLFLSQHKDAEDILRKSEHIPPYSNHQVDGFEYIIGLDHKSLNDCLDAQDMLSQLLDNNHIDHTITDKYEKINRIKFKSQPKWVDIDNNAFEKILKSYDKSSGKSLLNYTKIKIAEMYKVKTKPPKWLQEPQWPISPDGEPLMFVKQNEIKGIHDTTYEYIFLNEKTGESITITQSA